MRRLFDRYIVPLLFVVLSATLLLFIPIRSDVWAEMKRAHEPKSELLAEGEYLISPYDKIFRRVCRRHGVDWRLMSAIAYGESNFRPDVISPRGAVGLMQVMPWIAKSFGVEREQLLDPETNIDVAARLFKSMERMLRLPISTKKRDRMAFTLASYNCGASRVIDSRKLAKFYGENSHSWDVVAGYLEMLDEEECYNHEVVTCGKFSEGDITIYYVEKVLKRYDRYCLRDKKSTSEELQETI